MATNWQRLIPLTFKLSKFSFVVLDYSRPQGKLVKQSELEHWQLSELESIEAFPLDSRVS